MDDARITALEEKLTFLEQQVGTLDEVLRSLHDRVDAIGRQMTAAADDVRKLQFQMGPRLDEDEKPPHW